jgi:hypothetical protein
MKSPGSVAAYVKALSDFARPMIERIRRIILQTAPDLDEGVRWNSPTYKGHSLVCAFAAFQKHVSLAFWRGAELDDPKKLLVHGQGRSPMRTAKFTEPGQLDEKMIRAWVAAAVKIDAAGTAPKPARRKRPEAAVPPALAKALKKNAAARKTFAAVPPSHRREYCEWIAEAKQEETIARRVAKAVEKLADGEGLNDRYR